MRCHRSFSVPSTSGSSFRLPTHSHQRSDIHALRMLEGAQHLEPRVVPGDATPEDLLGGQTAHSPSPRITWNGTLRFQSMNWFIVSRPNSTGIARSRTSSSKAF